jgi:hypothetical protein
LFAHTRNGVNRDEPSSCFHMRSDYIITFCHYRSGVFRFHCHRLAVYSR